MLRSRVGSDGLENCKLLRHDLDPAAGALAGTRVVWKCSNDLFVLCFFSRFVFARKDWLGFVRRFTSECVTAAAEFLFEIIVASSWTIGDCLLGWKLSSSLISLSTPIRIVKNHYL